MEIPRSTAASWIRRGLGDVVSLDEGDAGGEAVLRDRVAELEQRVAMLTAVLRLVLALLRVSGFTWTVASRLDPMNTHAVLTAAAGNLAASASANVHMDSAVENLNGAVDPLFERSALHRVIAQIDVTFSNSLIEAWWRSLKHRWLYLHQLDNIATVRRLVEFYVTEHNERIPHAGFDGQTPDEIYLGRGARSPDELAAQRREARERRMERNRAVACGACPQGAPAPSEDLAA